MEIQVGNHETGKEQSKNQNQIRGKKINYFGRLDVFQQMNL